jgi:hypothetical protein
LGDLVLGIGLIRDGRRVDRPRARLRHAFEQATLVGRVPLDRSHEVRDEVIPATELHVDLGPAVVDAVPQRHETVVDEHGRDERDDDDRDDDPPPGRHARDSSNRFLTVYFARS